MHPAFSVLFFTVSAGFGYGLLCHFLILDVITRIESGSNGFRLGVLLLASVLFTIGLISSTFHLANPKNAWRSFVRVGTSWLSREGVLAIVIYPLVLLMVVQIIYSQVWVAPRIIACLLVALSVLLLFVTGMIYASLKTIPQWHLKIVPINFILFALSSGGLLYGALVNWSQSVGLLVIGCLIFGLLGKLVYFWQIGRPQTTTINTATQLTQGQVMLFDSGHSSENFLQREFIYQVGPKTKRLARIMSLLLAFILPLLMLLVLKQPAAILSWLLVASIFIGLLLERWLFFVEAEHVVRRYYGH